MKEFIQSLRSAALRLLTIQITVSLHHLSFSWSLTKAERTN